MEVLYHKAIFCGDIPLHRLLYGRYLHFRILKFPLNFVEKDFIDAMAEPDH
jgi:hypothetical protein